MLALGGGIIAVAFWVPWREGAPRYEPARVVIWSLVGMFQTATWAAWLWRWPWGFRDTLIGGIAVVAFWLIALELLGSPPFVA